MLSQLRIELIKILKRPRTYIGPIGTTCLVALIMTAIKYGHMFRHMQARIEQNFMITGSYVNAEFVTRYVLLPPVLFTFLPLFSCMIFGDLIAGEAADGTLRTLLCRPVTRTRVVASKFITGVLYAIALTFWMGISAYILGSIFLGHGSLLTIQGSTGIWILSEHQAIIRLIEVYALVSLGMISIGSVSFAISTFLNNPNGAIASAVGIMVVSGIVGEIDYFHALKPYLLTTYIFPLDRFFTDKLDTAYYLKSIEVMAVYAIVSLLVAMVVFRRRDVLV